MMTNCLLIINPSSGKGNGRALEKRIVDTLSHSFNEISVVYTNRRGDGERLVLEASTNLDVVFCVGGDGTVKEVVNGIMKTNQAIKLGIFPNGTVNDAARSLGIPVKTEEALLALRDLELTSMDIGQVNHNYFISLIAIGGIPEAIHNVSVEAKSKYGILAYFFNGAFYASRQKPFHLRLKTAMEEDSVETSLFVLSLHPTVASMPKFFQRARYNDGLLHTLLFPSFQFFGAAFYVWRILRGRINQTKRLTYGSYQQLIIDCNNANLTINIDGDKEGAFPLDVTILPSAISVYIPKK